VAPDAVLTFVPASAHTLVDVAASNPDFSATVTAVTGAGLGGTPNGYGPFTVFAATDIEASDGVAHVTDEVILPPSTAMCAGTRQRARAGPPRRSPPCRHRGRRRRPCSAFAMVRPRLALPHRKP